MTKQNSIDDSNWMPKTSYYKTALTICRAHEMSEKTGWEKPAGWTAPRSINPCVCIFYKYCDVYSKDNVVPSATGMCIKWTFPSVKFCRYFVNAFSLEILQHTGDSVEFFHLPAVYHKSLFFLLAHNMVLIIPWMYFEASLLLTMLFHP